MENKIRFIFPAILRMLKSNKELTMIKRNEHIEKINELIDDENYHEIGDTVEGYIQEIEDKIQDAIKELNDINRKEISVFIK